MGTSSDNGNDEPFGEPLWDDWGRPRHPHVACPRCGDADEVGSSFDHAWCHCCSWHGSLTDMRRSAPEMVVTNGLPSLTAKTTSNVIPLFPRRR